MDEMARSLLVEDKGCEADQYVAGVGDGRVGQHTLDRRFARGSHVAEGHGQYAEYDNDGHPLVRRGAERLGEDAHRSREAAALGPTDMNAVMGVGAPW